MTDPLALAAAFVLGLWLGGTLVYLWIYHREVWRRPDATECWPGPTVIDAQIQRIKWGLRQRDLITRARALEADTEARPPETVASTPPDERRSGGGA